MGQRHETSGSTPPRRAPAATPEAREKQLSSLAYDLAEKQIREGTASSQVISHFLKAGSSREKAELERLRRENHLLKAKAESMESAKKVEELYTEAMASFRAYSGQEPMMESDDYDYED